MREIHFVKYLKLLEAWPTDRPIPALYTDPLTQRLKEYYAVGGMPEAVKEWCDSHDMSVVEEIQDEILRDYADDFAKHAPVTQIEKMSIPPQNEHRDRTN